MYQDRHIPSGTVVYIFSPISLWDFSNILCLEMDSWQFCGRDFWDIQTVVKGREVKWGEENSWLLYWFRYYWPLLSLFFHVPKLGANGKAALCLPECSQCIQFPVLRAWDRKQKQTRSEGRGKWEVTEVRAWRAQMGNGGKSGGGRGRHMVLVTQRYACHLFL